MDQIHTPMNQTRPSTAGTIDSMGPPPDIKLRTLRENLAEFLGDDSVTDKFVFLKCVGSSLAVVKLRQEYDLKLKSFAPPYAREPELYLLPGDLYEGSVYASTVSPEQRHFQAEYSSSEQSEARADAIIDERTTVQPIPENDPAAPRPPQDGGRSFIWNKKRGDVVPATSQIQIKFRWRAALSYLCSTGKHRVTKRGPALSNPMFTLVTGIVGRWRAVCVTALQRPNSDAAAIDIVVGNIKQSEIVGSEDGKILSGRNPTGDSGIAHSLLGAELDRSQHKRQETFIQENPANRGSRDERNQSIKSEVL
ncbi:unnamed protein product [Ranitomeya imitator]|uniref:Uncharacterized protein n=1 Tax=Ranitomeya imitator TaxID=111125 RepID=A0ABN9M6U0_9NEOB|nr:unnamed protein product [Ranitomeya imitator]